MADPTPTIPPNPVRASLVPCTQVTTTTTATRTTRTAPVDLDRILLSQDSRPSTSQVITIILAAAATLPAQPTVSVILPGVPKKPEHYILKLTFSHLQTDGDQNDGPLEPGQQKFTTKTTTTNYSYRSNGKGHTLF